MSEENVKPKHYAECSVECIDVMDVIFGTKATVEFCFMNAFKYIWRHKNKGGEVDLNKAKTYIDMAKDIIKQHDLWDEDGFYKTQAQKLTHMVNMCMKKYLRPKKRVPRCTIVKTENGFDVKDAEE